MNNISDAQLEICNILESGKNWNRTFIETHSPDLTKQDAAKGFVVVNVTSAIYDYNAIKVGSILINVYTKQLPNGSKDIRLASAIEDNINSIISGTDFKNKGIYMNRLGAYNDFNEKTAYHTTILEYNLRIKN